MKNLMSALAISALLASPVFAEGEHQHDGDPNTQGKQGSMMMSHERMMPMMQERMGMMQMMMGQMMDNMVEARKSRPKHIKK